jgi:1-deoxy-D-xylulose-5-phosphate reductoisomerase
MKTLAIIGSTGSIGASSLKVYKKNKEKFNLLFLAANSNFTKLKKQKKIYKPKYSILFKSNLSLEKKYNFSKKETLYNLKKKIDFVISGVSGFDSLDINIKLLKISKNLLIANKETIICGGSFFMNIAKRYNCNLIPIDSEHHCIDFFLKQSKFKNELSKVFLIASGGPFFKKKIKYNQDIKTVIKHPIWKMGKKISVDSSTFANKVLELFEAKTLFNLNSKQLDIKVDTTSNTHALIKLKNKIYFSIMHFPNMVVSISNALKLKNNFDINFNHFNLNLVSPSKKKFPLITLGLKILRMKGDRGPVIFTVLNERLVNMFLLNKIKYGDICISLLKIFDRKNIIRESKKQILNLKDVRKTINFAEKIDLCS